MAGAAPVAGGAGGLAFMLRAFRSRNYRLFFGGQIVSLTGTWITTTATSWLVYRLTHSVELLGVVGFASQVPSFLLTPFAGIVVDRVNRHRLLVLTQTASMVVSFVLALLILTHTMSIPWLIGVSIVQGIVNAFDLPGRQSFVIKLVEDPRDLANAIALNSSMFNAARLVGPSVAGAVIALTNEGWCFLIDGISYVFVIGALLAMRVSGAPPVTGPAPSPLRQFLDGWRYTAQSRAIRSLIALVGITCLLGVPYTVMMPVYAASILRGGPHTLGILMTSAGGGALLGALWLAGRRGGIEGLSRLIPFAGAAFGLGLIAFAYSTVVWLSCLCLVLAGAGFMVQFASSNTLLQTIVEDAKRGRVMAFFLMAYFGTTPFGSLVAGWASGRIGTPLTLAIGGGACVAGCAWFALQLSAIRTEMAPVLARVQAGRA